MKENRLPVLIEAPATSLKKKLSSPGGISRETALARAQECLQAQRQDAIEDLIGRIVTLRQMGGALDGMQMSEEEMNEMLTQLDEILNIAGTFQMWNLVTTTAFLHDLVRRKAGRLNVDALNTFTHAMQLFAIPSKRFEADGLIVLEQLRRLFEFSGQSSVAPMLKIA